MQQYNNRIRTRDIFMNPKLVGVFPQFEPGEQLQNVYSFAQTEKRVCDYLVAALNGEITADGIIAVNGKHETVLNLVRALQAVIEGFINDMPKVIQALRNNTPLYLPYVSVKQLQNTDTLEAKIKAMQAVMDNFQYNSDLDALNSIKHEKPAQFERNKHAWEKKVGYRRLKRV